MSDKFKAIVIDNQNEKFTREIKEIDKTQFKDGNVLVKVDYSSLNYKDALILNDGGKIVRKFPFVPGIDFSGTVVESEDSKFTKDDKVILTGFRVGEAYFGGFSQYAKVDSNFSLATTSILVMTSLRFSSDFKMIDPPFPPSPPSGPPYSINFSLLKLGEPSPPFPALTYIFT